MRHRWSVALVCAAVVNLSFAATASAERPLPSWYTSAFAQKVHDAGFTNNFASGKPYQYARADMGPEYYDYGAPASRMVNVSVITSPYQPR